MDFTEIAKALKELSNISSNNEKIEWLKNHDDESFKNILRWYFDTSKVTGIAEKKFDKKTQFSLFGDFGTCDVKTFDNVIQYLDFHHTGTDEDIRYMQYLRSEICEDDFEKETFKKLVCKNYPMGVNYTTINKVFPNLVPCYEVMLADKYLDLNETKKNKLFTSGRTFCIQEKLDGFRCTIWKEGKSVKLISRQGKLIEGLVDIEDEIRKNPYHDFILDGELLLTDRENIPSKLQYKETSKIVSTKEKEKHGITFNAFDLISIFEWKNKECDTNYECRYSQLCELLKGHSKNISIVPNLVVTDNISEIDNQLKIAKEKDWEGIMVRFMDSPYEWKRSNNLLKVKPFLEMDMIITGYEEGTNSNTGRLGAFLCEVEHPEYGKIKCKVGGGYADYERITFWDMRDKLIGRVMSVQYFEVTQNTTTNEYSLRFPEFLELKAAGQEINN